MTPVRVTARTAVAAVAGVLVAALSLSACAEEPEVIQPTDPPTTVDPTVVVDKTAAPEPVIPPTWPLTGIEGEIAERPALAIKIETTSPARPQTGLEAADMVWEEMIEGGQTRLNAIFHSSIPEEVGPIRSVRPMDAGIAAPLGGIIVFSGGQGPFVQQMRDAGLQVMSNDEGAPGMYRVSFRRAPYNVYGDPNVFLANANDSRNTTPPQQFVFAETADRATAATAGTPATTVTARFPATRSAWTWDGSRWLRSQDGTAHTVASGAQLGADNVVVLRVDLVDTGTTDAAGATVYETVMVDSGEALVATGGRTVSATWSKTGVADPVVLTGADGVPVRLAPGVTWIELVPGTGLVEVS